MAIQKMVVYEVRFPDFHDALRYTEAEAAALSEADVEAAAQKRYDDWVAFVAEQSSKPPVKPTKEELEARKEELVAEVAKVEAQIAEAVAIAEPIEEEPINP